MGFKNNLGLQHVIVGSEERVRYDPEKGAKFIKGMYVHKLPVRGMVFHRLP
jgi:hypothetical protein